MTLCVLLCRYQHFARKSYLLPHGRCD